MSAEVGSLILSGIAILVSIVLFIRQHSLQGQLTAIEEARRDEELAARLVADVTARIDTEPAHTGVRRKDFLTLVNRGPALARQVDVEILETEGGKAPDLMKEGMVFPVQLDSGQTYPIHCSFYYGGSPSLPILLRWVDGRGPQTKPLTLASE
jgi:hypothetical protein